MSEISDLARSFEQRSKRLADDTEKRVQSALKQHEKRLLTALEQSASTTERAIRDQNRRLSKLALKGWLWIVVTLFLVSGVSIPALWWTGNRIKSNLAEIQHQKTVLADLASKGGQIHLNHCGQSRRLCVAVDPSQTFTASDGTKYMIAR